MKGDKRKLFLDLHRLWGHVSSRRRVQLFFLFVLTLLGTIAELASIGMAIPFLGALTAPHRVFDHVLAQPLINGLHLTDPEQLLLPLTLLFGVAAVFSGGVRIALLWCQAHLGNAIGNDLGSQAYGRTLYQPYAVHVSRNSSEVVAVLMTKVNSVIYHIIIPVLTIITSACIVLTIVAIMFLVEPELTAMVCLGFSCLYIIVAYVTKKRLVQDGERVTAGQSRIAQTVQEGLGGIRDVLIGGVQEAYLDVYRKADARYRRAAANITFLGGAPRPVIEAFGLVLIGFLAFMFANRQEGIATAIPMLGALALAAQRLLPLVQQGYAGWTSILGGHASLRDVLALLEQPVPFGAGQELPAPMLFKREIGLTDLWFKYGFREPWVLKGVDLRIPRGSKVGFIGTTGSGKSTLLDIVMGLLEPTKGALSIDGNKVTQDNRRAWQAHIAHVPQMIHLTDATIAENIAFGERKEDIDLDRVQQAARQAQIADTIKAWKDGYNTVVGERGIRLSGGQRQRLGIARALYKQADVIVFDEATSALDGDTERAVMESITCLDVSFTVLMVAHRITTLKDCELIVEVDGGLISRIGSYQDIIHGQVATSQNK